MPYHKALYYNKYFVETLGMSVIPAGLTLGILPNWPQIIGKYN
jgi:hypothetical protein